MSIQTINPFSNEVIATYSLLQPSQLEAKLQLAEQTFHMWSKRTMAQRATPMRALCEQLKHRKKTLAGVITEEMGKLHHEAIAEIEKCAWVCEHYAEHAENYLAPQTINTEAQRSYICYQPLGPLLAIMPWNYPFWQVFRALAPNLMAGNTLLLKHASNVPQCSQAIEQLVQESGFPDGCMQSLLVNSKTANELIKDQRIRGVTLTGSEFAGRSVGSLAGQHLKKSVLELGGSDPFIVCDDADLQQAVDAAVTSRCMNAGQTCIAAKRFFVMPSVADDFIQGLINRMQKLMIGDPSDDQTTLAPLARIDLRNDLHNQVLCALDEGAKDVIGCQIPDRDGNFYLPSLLDNVSPNMSAFQEELFGPVASVIRVRNSDEAIQLANQSHYGLGASIWSKDINKAEQIASCIDAGSCFINSFVKSHCALPFGGIKNSGYGRELGAHGIQEFTNIKTIWIQ
ncbi:NAD-dependent succinate-semialdehyde dehydrogenase [Zooshikella sp. RANM57]|uniref:NAD-dependent succinate-semialdehyde dehydrogenase n=1 Tax=Zooshikella sp. RANM57 TaxID=3425863 RepID=UPI003D6FCFF6